MKIQCEYCNSMFNDTLEQCPNCGAPNKNVRRSTSDQPTTIEQLKEWYESKGLPPYETTRFFIGEDYKGAKAFGIYKDETSGNCVVYKNKADGSRAVRYEGTDEAFAVNELLTRLKQEILQQKAHNNNTRNTGIGNSAGGSSKGRTSILKRLKKIFFIFLIITVAGFIISAVNKPSVSGYYSYDDELYYHYYDDEKYGWAYYDESKDDWVDIFYSPYSELMIQRKAKNYFLSEDYKNKYGGFDYEDSVAYDDRMNGHTVSTGYYSYDGDVYYHMQSYYSYGWYTYDYDDDEWYEIDYDEMPDALLHETYAEDFWYTPDWSSETQLTDFEDSAIYQDYQDSQSSYSYDDDSSSSSWDDDDDYDYDWDDDYDSWDYDSSDWDSDW